MPLSPGPRIADLLPRFLWTLPVGAHHPTTAHTAKETQQVTIISLIVAIVILMAVVCIASMVLYALISLLDWVLVSILRFLHRVLRRGRL